MKVTGYQLMRALKELAFDKETAEGVFDDSMWKFEGELKAHPADAAIALQKAEVAFANVQFAQAIYNQKIDVTVEDQKMALGLAIKLVGGAGRVEKKWREAAKPPKKDRFDFSSNQQRKRDDGTEYAIKQITTEDAQMLAKNAAKYAAALREAIQVGNSAELHIDGLDPALFE